MHLLTKVNSALIHKINTIIKGPHVGNESWNVQKNYTKEVKDPSMASYIVNNSTYGGLKMYNLSLSLKRMQQAYTRLKRMLVDNESLTAYLVPLVDPMTSPLYGFTSVIPFLEEKLLLL